jgi:hypothetical protein
MKTLKMRSDATSADIIAKKRDMLEVSRMVKRNSITCIIHRYQLDCSYYNFLSLIFFQTVVISTKKSSKKDDSLYYDSEDIGGDIDEDDVRRDPDWENKSFLKRWRKSKVPHLFIVHFSLL